MQRKRKLALLAILMVSIIGVALGAYVLIQLFQVNFTGTVVSPMTISKTTDAISLGTVNIGQELNGTPSNPMGLMFYGTSYQVDLTSSIAQTYNITCTLTGTPLMNTTFARGDFYLSFPFSVTNTLIFQMTPSGSGYTMISTAGTGSHVGTTAWKLITFTAGQKISLAATSSTAIAIVGMPTQTGSIAGTVQFDWAIVTS